MKPYVSDPDFQLYVGDVREVLATLPDESVQCVVTSPPYWGLRDYGVDGQLGLEPTPELYVENMVAVFREVGRVLRKDGTCWLNIGDSYAGSWGAQSRDNGNDAKSTLDGGSMLSARQIEAHPKGQTHTGSLKNTPGLKPKDLCGIPWRLAFALQADGWYLRSEIIWAKPNPMPESVTDRPTKSHEQVFLLTRSARYFYDADAVRELAVGPDRGPGMTRGVNGPHAEQAGLDRRARRTALVPNQTKAGVGTQGIGSETFGHYSQDGGRNLRSVWEIPTQPFAEAHFATYPQALVERCVKAGTSERGCCPECGAPWERETKREPMEIERSGVSPYDHHSTRASGKMVKPATSETVGWKPTCGPECVNGHNFLTQNACVVLDPFLGSGTTALVARRLGRRSVGIELNETYAEMASRRLSQQSLLADVA